MVGTTRDNSLHLPGTKSSKQRRVYLDLINSVAIMWVVLLHVRFISPDNPSSSAWWVENILSGFGVAAVPLFFMATGINLLDFTRRESIGTFYRKRFTKILIPMILWAQVYLFVHMWTGSTPFPGVHEILRTLVAPSSEAATFWYLEVLVGVYLVLPIFSYAIRGVQAEQATTARTRFLWLMAALGLFLPILTQGIHLLRPNIFPEFIAPITGYLGFCLLGYALANTEFSRAWRIVIYLSGVLGLAVYIFGGAYLIAHRPDLKSVAHGYLALPAILWASAVLVFCKYSRIGQASATVQNILKRLAALTFGIYLVHLLIIQILEAMNFSLTKVQWEVPYALFVWALSAVIVWMLRLIPPIRRWILP